MYDLFIAPFTEFEFMRRALAGTFALALGAGPLGVFLMLRRMSLVGDAMAHAILPGAAGNSFWLKGSAWQFPDYENVDTFVDRLVRDEVLLFDPAVNAALQDQLHAQAMPSRTLRHRFLRATGLTQSRIRQVERAQRAAALLRRGTSILDTVHEIGYFDQPHLTRALRQWVGYTPAQIVRMSMVACHSVQDNDLDLVYDTNVLNIADDQYPTNREAHDELDA